MELMRKLVVVVVLVATRETAETAVDGVIIMAQAMVVL